MILVSTECVAREQDPFTPWESPSFFFLHSLLYFSDTLNLKQTSPVAGKRLRQSVCNTENIYGLDLIPIVLKSWTRKFGGRGGGFNVSRPAEFLKAQLGKTLRSILTITIAHQDGKAHWNEAPDRTVCISFELLFLCL